MCRKQISPLVMRDKKAGRETELAGDERHRLTALTVTMIQSSSTREKRLNEELGVERARSRIKRASLQAIIRMLA